MAAQLESVNVEQLSLSSREASEHVKGGDYILKRKKNARGSRACMGAILNSLGH